MPKISDADLIQEALDLTRDAPEGDRVREILQELRRRTTTPIGQQRFVSSWAAGRRARSDGVPLEECPFVEKPGRRTFITAHRNAWIRGWKGMDKGFAQLDLCRASLRQLLRKQRVG